jgi:hypothetical protein
MKANMPTLMPPPALTTALKTAQTTKTKSRAKPAPAKKKAKTALPLLMRDEYGALKLNSHLQTEQIADARALLAKACALAGGLPKAYSAFTKREFECVNHDVYDVLLSRGKVRGLVVQVRAYWRLLKKPRTRLTKSYFLVTAVRNKVSVEELENATCTKRAKNTHKLGELAGHYLGVKTVKCFSPTALVSTAYKVLAKTEDARLVSAYDGSEYPMGQWRHEKARPQHAGGYYCYLERALAVSSTTKGTTFHASVSQGKSLVLCTVEISGTKVVYDSGKVAVSQIRVVKELHALDIPPAHDAKVA